MVFKTTIMLMTINTGSTVRTFLFFILILFFAFKSVLLLNSLS
jgi:hypothetical protein